MTEKRRNGFWNRRKCFRMKGSSHCGRVAQLGERVLCKHEVAGSIPVTSTKLLIVCIELGSFVSALNSTFWPPPFFGAFNGTLRPLARIYCCATDRPTRRRIQYAVG